MMTSGAIILMNLAMSHLAVDMDTIGTVLEQGAVVLTIIGLLLMMRKEWYKKNIMRKMISFLMGTNLGMFVLNCMYNCIFLHYDITHYEGILMLLQIGVSLGSIVYMWAVRTARYGMMKEEGN